MFSGHMTIKLLPACWLCHNDFHLEDINSNIISNINNFGGEGGVVD